MVMLEKKRAHNYGAGNSANVNFAAERGDLAAGGTAHAARALKLPPQAGFPVFGGGGGAPAVAVGWQRDVFVRTFIQTLKMVQANNLNGFYRTGRGDHGMMGTCYSGNIRVCLMRVMSDKQLNVAGTFARNDKIIEIKNSRQ